jgi:hypothetical protein
MDNSKIQNMIAVLQSDRPEGTKLSTATNGLNKEDIVQNSMLKNAAPAGFQQIIDTLTLIKAEVIAQKFYEINPADYVPIKVGEGAFTEESLYYTNFKLGDDFESGIMDQGNTTRKARTDVGYDSKRLKNFFWAKEMDYSLIQVQQAAANAGSAISLISQKEEARKINWDLGIQKTAFLGQDNISDIDGLLTLSGVTVDTSTLVKPISAMTSTEINAFAKDIVKVYWNNSNNTAFPDTFCIPTTDALGLSTFVAENQPLTTKMAFLEQAFKMATRNPNFQIISTQYNDLGANDLGVNRYALYRNDSRTLEMNIPIDYTSTSFGTVNNFDFSSVAYGQFSGVIAKRPLEIYYLDHSVVI